MPRSSRTITLRWSLFRNLSLLIAVLSGAILVSTFVTAHQLAQNQSRAQLGRAAESTLADFDGFFAPLRNGLLLSREWAMSGAIDVRDEEGFKRVFLPIMRRFPQISSVSLGDARGHSLLLLRLGDRWRTRELRPDEWGARIRFREWSDDELEVREWWLDDAAESVRLDPRNRAWYQVVPDEPGGAGSKSASGEPYWTEPYAFATTGAPGITAALAVALPDASRIVLAFDVLLSDLSDFTQKIRLGEDGFALALADVGDPRVVGLPRSPRFDDAIERDRALLRPVSELDLPVLVAALRARDRRGRSAGVLSFRAEGETHWAGARSYALGPNRSMRVVVIVPERDLLGMVRRQRLYLAGASVLAIVVGSVMALLLARRYARPLGELVDNSQRMRELDLAGARPVHSKLREVQELADVQARVRATLDSFARYLPVDLVRELLRRGEAARIGGENRVLTILFTDIEGFTSVAERLSPEALVAHMSDYFQVLLETIHEHGGEVNQLLGDGVLAFWGAPVPDPEHATHAVDAVLHFQRELDRLHAQWRSDDRPLLPTRFGLATGEVVVGNVGAPSRLAYAAVGDSVNLASRLEGLNRFYGTRALASATVRDATSDHFEWRHIDAVRAKGKREIVELHQPLGQRDQVEARVLEQRDVYEQALALYRERDFAHAHAVLERVLEPDGATRRLRELCRELDAAPPSGDWEGVTEYHQK